MKQFSQPMGTTASLIFVAAAIAVMFIFLLACNCRYLGDIPTVEHRHDRNSTSYEGRFPLESPVELPAVRVDMDERRTSGIPQPSSRRSTPAPAYGGYFLGNFLFSLLQ